MNHAFIVKLSYAFQNKKKLYFAMSYCPGGELFNLLAKKKHFSEP
jgi:serum/glucocorticoid-regulated kinase 2